MYFSTCRRGQGGAFKLNVCSKKSAAADTELKTKKVALARIAHCLAHNLYKTQSWVHVKISPEMIPSGWQGSKHQLTSHDKNSLSSCCIQVKCLSWGKRHPSLLRTAVHCDSVSGCNMTFFTDWFSKLVCKGVITEGSGSSVDKQRCTDTFHCLENVKRNNNNNKLPVIL